VAWDARQALRDLVADERGTVHKDAPQRIALVYPSPYRAAMSSLGYQTIYRRLNEIKTIAADRAVLPDDVAAYRDSGAPLMTLEREEPVGNYPLIAFSVAYELEIAGLIDCLRLSGLEALAADRAPEDPLVVAGGPLTFSNPVPLAPFVDVVVLGEGELLVEELAAVVDQTRDRQRVIEQLHGRPGFYIPSLDGDTVGPVGAAPDALLPARSQIITPNTELSNMFLTEAARGCSRGCTYCVMRRSTNGGMRIVEPEVVLAGIPDHAQRVGLVGAAVTDHPGIAEIVRGVVDAGRGVGISSLLAKGGYRTLTVACDGASERLRTYIERATTEAHLIHAARLAAASKLHTLKLYLMVGLPTETDDDIDELIRFTAELRAIHRRIAFGVAPFVAKRHTPMDGAEFAGIKVVEKRLDRLRRGLKGTAEVRPTSARWAWVEYMLAQGDASAGLALMDAHDAGGSFAAYKKAFKARGVEPTGPRARVPSTTELIALRKRENAARGA
jgi:radical SAM superfamily enzyme YgiQ (UPF0313 family)